MISELDRIRRVYTERDFSESIKKYHADKVFMDNIICEREKIYTRIIHNHFIQTSELRIIEIGAGGGGNIPFFIRMGIPCHHIFANELMDNRIAHLRNKFDNINIIPGDATRLTFQNEFDIVFQSTVFTSILDNSFRKILAGKMWDILKKGGIVLWYDFVYLNARNKNIKNVAKAEVASLFPGASKIKFYRVTLAPPIARKVGRYYRLINTVFCFLRTHLIAEIHK